MQKNYCKLAVEVSRMTGGVALLPYMGIGQ